MDQGEGQVETWTNEDVVDAILRSTSEIVGAVNRLRTTVIVIALIPVGFWLLIILINLVSFAARY